MGQLNEGNPQDTANEALIPGPPRELTFGEKAVGITFNPGGMPGGMQLKKRAL